MTSTTLLILLGQFAHSVLRTAAVQAIAQDNAWAVMALNAGANLVRLLVLSGGVMAVVGSDWITVAAVVAGQAAGDWVSMRFGKKALVSSS
jgi:hypothetical protein